MAVDHGLHAFKVETHYRGDTLLNRPDQQTLRAAVPPVLASRPWCPVVEWNGKLYAIHGEPRIFQRLPSDGSRRLRDRP